MLTNAKLWMNTVEEEQYSCGNFAPVSVEYNKTFPLMAEVAKYFESGEKSIVQAFN